MADAFEELLGSDVLSEDVSNLSYNFGSVKTSSLHNSGRLRSPSRELRP
jgi:hypothetical protein